MKSRQASINTTHAPQQAPWQLRPLEHLERAVVHDLVVKCERGAANPVGPGGRIVRGVLQSSRATLLEHTNMNDECVCVRV